MTLDVLEGVGVMPRDRRLVVRRRQEVDDRIEQTLDTLVLESGATQHRIHQSRQRPLSDRAEQVLTGVGLLVQVVVEQLLVVLRHGFDQSEARRVRRLDQVAWNLALDQLGAVGVVFVRDGLHGDEVDGALERVAREDRHVDGHGLGAEAVTHHLHDVLEVGADAVHFVHERDARHVVLIGLAPHGLGLGLDTTHGAEHGDRAVEHAKRALDFDGEVHVTRGIDDVDAVIAPQTGGGSGRDGDTALTLLLHPVHRGGAFVHLARAMDTTRIEKHALGQGGLAGVDMGHDPDVAVFVERSNPSHLSSLPLRSCKTFGDTTCLSVKKVR